MSIKISKAWLYLKSDQPDQVWVAEIVGENTNVLELRVAKSDRARSLANWAEMHRLSELSRVQHLGRLGEGIFWRLLSERKIWC